MEPSEGTTPGTSGPESVSTRRASSEGWRILREINPPGEKPTLRSNDGREERNR
jgi:hypothetical protein